MKIEFYFDKTGCFPKKLYFKLGNQVWTDFEELSNEEIEAIYCEIKRLSVQGFQGLIHLSRYIHTGKKDILRQFIFCNWTILNKQWDISNHSLNFEYVECPHKHTNTCPYNGKGIVCIKLNPDIV